MIYRNVKLKIRNYHNVYFFLLPNLVCQLTLANILSRGTKICCWWSSLGWGCLHWSWCCHYTQRNLSNVIHPIGQEIAKQLNDDMNNCYVLTFNRRGYDAP